MKLLYSQLKKYLPELKASAVEVGDVFTQIGYMLDGVVEEVKYLGETDFLMDLEVRQNRADCFGVQGLARELSAYYNIPMHQSIYNTNFKINDANEKENIPIEVKAKKAVKRVLAVKISDLTVGPSPEWLREYLAFYEINSINNLVDLTNLVMVETAHPSHAFDLDKMGKETLTWEMNSKTDYKFSTLDSTQLILDTSILTISDGDKPLSLAMIGGKDVAIDENTKNIILEIAIYDGGLVRRNSRKLKVFTEAGSRLEKFMDPDSIPQAFELLVSLILENCGGQIASKVFDEYNDRLERNVITVDLDKVQQIAGVEIMHDQSVQFLERLGFEIKSRRDSQVEVTRPLDRFDIEMQEDVWEEIIRLKGFYHLPKDQLLSRPAKDITPKHLTIIDSTYELMSYNGFDEVRSWVLVEEKLNELANYGNWKAISAENSINEEAPILRSSLGVSLLGQLNTSNKNYIVDVRLFEIGKVFGIQDGQFLEFHSLGILINRNDVNLVKEALEKVLRTFGFDSIIYTRTEKAPESAVPTNCFDIHIRIGSENHKVGILYITNKLVTEEAAICEINLDIFSSLQNDEKSTTKEITKRIVTLDTNVELSDNENINENVIDLLENIEYIWAWEVVDKFKINDSADSLTKYTVRVSYFDLSDQDAKDLHKKIFG